MEADKTYDRIFLSTPSARRATERTPHPVADYGISIHALREEGDLAKEHSYESVEHISIHALREEGDACRTERPAGHGYFYPRPPRGGRPLNADFGVVGHDFYPRPPRGGRPKSWSRQSPQSNFYPRPPRGGRPRLLARLPVLLRTISIHALREEGDHKLLVHTASVFNFYPRPPRGGRQQRDNAADDVMRFLSTPSARRATPRA